MELLGQLENFPGGLGVKNLPGKAGASADAGSIPGLGTIPHADRQIGPCPTTIDACVPGARALQQEKPPHLRSLKTATRE